MMKPEPPQTTEGTMDLGANLIDDSTARFRVWAPAADTVEVCVTSDPPFQVPLEKVAGGYWEGLVSPVAHGTRYQYRLNGHITRPDPASRFQPAGVHGPSAIVDPHAFSWSDREWKGRPLEEFLIYEIHTGTFTHEGTFDAIIPHLPYLHQEVGVTAIELMPVAQCPGERNWGYDGVYLFAPQTNYGGPDGLKRLVDACHRQGMAVILDVVYNHFGPEGNYLGDFGPYFTSKYQTPWGQAINYDGPESDAVRHFVISNAQFWVTEYHMDALRLDAIHGIYDFSAKHVLQELTETVHDTAHARARIVAVIAESDLNDPRIILPPSKGGYGLDAQWNDDFHHALHCLLTGEQGGYYGDFGRLEQLAVALRDGYVYAGSYSPFRRRRHGNSAKDCAPSQFIVYAQNHDQIGNRAQGERLATLISPEALKVAAATVLLAPNIPLLFMGEEYAETAPFLYFIDHGDPALLEAVRRGRMEEFAAFGWKTVPDPAAVESFNQSRLHRDLQTQAVHQQHLHWTQTLIALRAAHPSLGTAQKKDTLHVQPDPHSRTLTIHRKSATGEEALIILGFHNTPTEVTVQAPTGDWRLLLDANNQKFGGKAPQSAPSILSIQNQSVPVTLPPFPAWVYLKE